MREVSGDCFSSIEKTYSKLFRQYGDDARALDYGSPRSQEAKFRALAAVMPLAGRRVLDVGCGLAHLADFLDVEANDIDYTGVDLSADLIQAARARQPHLRLFVGNILDRDAPWFLPGHYDVVLSTGIFYLLGEAAQELVPRMIECMWDLCSAAVAFTTLSGWAAEHDSAEFHLNPADAILMARTHTRWVTMRHDYHDRDLALYMYREPPA